MSSDSLSMLSDEERSWVERFRLELRQSLGDRLRDLRLYGSKARGDWHAESDIDLLILVQDLDHETSREISELAGSISLWMSPHIDDYDRYHSSISRASGFYKEMRRESIRLLTYPQEAQAEGT